MAEEKKGGSADSGAAGDKGVLGGGPAAGDKGDKSGDKGANADKHKGGDSAGDTGKDGDKGGDGHKGGSGDSQVPEKYDLKPPADSGLHDADVTQLATTAKAMGLTQKQAEQYLAREVERRQNDEATLSTARGAYLTALKGDPELGGSKFDAASEVAQRGFTAALAKLPEAERQVIISDLQISGRNNHKAWVRLFYNLGMSVKEDRPDHGNKGGDSGGGGEKTAAEKLYGTK